MHVNGALFDEDMVAPYPVEQLGSAVHALGMRHEEMQQPELSGAKLDLLGIAGHTARRWIELEPPRLYGRIERFRSLAPQHRTDARHQLIGGKRLGEIVVRASVQTRNLVGFFSTRGQHDQGQIACPGRRAPSLGQGHPGLARQHPVENGEVWQHTVHSRLGLLGTAGHNHFKAGMAQIDRDQLGNRRLVFHHQNQAHARLLAPRIIAPKSPQYR